MTDPIGFGILGCASIAQQRMAPAIQQSTAARLIAVGSLRPGAARQMADELGIPKAYDSYDAVLENPDIQAVYIPSTGDQHHPLTVRAAEAGKHVLCEKPLATTFAEAEEMVASCRRAGVIMQEAFMWRHHPRTKQVRQRLQEGQIGELRLICAQFSFDIDRSNWRLRPEKGGGAMWDLGCYGVNASRLFAGAEPNAIHARAHFDNTGLDLTMQIALSFPNDVLANIDCSFETASRCTVELVGTKGRIVLPDAFGPPDSAELKVYQGTAREVQPEVVQFPPANQFVEQVNDFCRSIAAGRLFDPAETGMANMRVLESALQKAKQAAGQT